MKHRINTFMERTGTKVSVNEMNVGLYRQLQLALVDKLLEEVLEFKESLLEKNYVNSVKELVDVMYVLSQCEINAEVAGINLNLAQDLVCDNNEGKYSVNYDFIEAKLLEYSENDPWAAAKLHISSTFVNGETYYCLKNDEGKVKKFIDYESVDLTDCVPKEYL